MYDAKQIANWFIRKARAESRTLSIMQLLKLVYISHGWHLEMFGSPLFRNRIEAWEHGPVIPDVYRTFRAKGVMVNDEAEIDGIEIAPHDESLLNDIFRIYGSKGPFQLSEMTHMPGGPWDKAKEKYGWYAPITDDLIHAHYKELRERG